MEKAVYFILILCGIVSQRIFHVSEENNAAEMSSNLLIRQKRIIGGSTHPFQSNPYLVHVLKHFNGHCRATLLTADVAITSAACFTNENTQNMRIASESKVSVLLHRIVIVIFLDPNYNSTHPTVKNLALVKFTQPIDFQESNNRPITIYSGNLATDHTMSRVVSWGRLIPARFGSVSVKHVETFNVSVLSLAFCRRFYPDIIGNGNICASGVYAGEYCDTNTDTGVPLIKNNQLLGIFVYREPSYPTNPNVFMNLLDRDIRRWIHEHVPTLRLRFRIDD